MNDLHPMKWVSVGLGGEETPSQRTGDCILATETKSKKSN